jgi:hypothetical protein
MLNYQRVTGLYGNFDYLMLVSISIATNPIPLIFNAPSFGPPIRTEEYPEPTAVNKHLNGDKVTISVCKQ